MVINKFKKWRSSFYFAFLIMSIFGLINGASLYFIGFHNIDLVFNDAYFIKELGGNKTIDDFADQYNANGDIITLRSLYIIGQDQIRNGIYFISISSIILGVTLEYFRRSK